MRVSERDLVRLKHIDQAISLIYEFIGALSYEEFKNNLMCVAAVIRQFEIIGEASAHISQDVQNRYSEVEWQSIKGFRNLLIHEYFRVDEEEIWVTIENDLPVLHIQIEAIIKDIEN